MSNRSHLWASLIFGLLAAPACAPGTSTTTLERILFADASPSLSLSDQVDIRTSLNFNLAEDGVTVLDPVCQLPVSALDVHLDDLNADGDPEVAISAGNACSAGNTGAILWLFARSINGRYRLVLHALAYGYRTTAHRVYGYPDLALGGPGFCHAVWRWNGKNYVFNHQEEEAEGGCDRNNN